MAALKGIIIALVLLGSALQLAPATSFHSLTDPSKSGGTGVFVLVAPPELCATGSCYQATYMNTINVTVTGIVFFVVHNTIGQTISYSTATINPAAGSDATAYLTLFDIQPGTYSATLFVTSTGGAAISNDTKVSFTLH